MNTLRTPPVFVLACALSFAALSSCASQDPGAFEIVSRQSPNATTNPTGPIPTTPVPTTDGGGGADGAAPTSAFFNNTAYAPGNPGVIDLAATHAMNGGPTSFDIAKGGTAASDCTAAACHGSGAPPTRQFLAAGAANAPDLEIGVKLANGTLRTGRSFRAPSTIFAIPLTAGDSIANAKIVVRNGTKESAMSAAVSSGSCSQGACHGGGQGIVFK